MHTVRPPKPHKTSRSVAFLPKMHEHIVAEGVPNVSTRMSFKGEQAWHLGSARAPSRHASRSRRRRPAAAAAGRPAWRARAAWPRAPAAAPPCSAPATHPDPAPLCTRACPAKTCQGAARSWSRHALRCRETRQQSTLLEQAEGHASQLRVLLLRELLPSHCHLARPTGIHQPGLVIVHPWHAQSRMGRVGGRTRACSSW